MERINFDRITDEIEHDIYYLNIFQNLFSINTRRDFEYIEKENKKMGGKISVQLSPDESKEIASKTGFSVAQVNKLYHRLVFWIDKNFKNLKIYPAGQGRQGSPVARRSDRHSRAGH